MKAALLRLARVLVAQLVTFGIAELSGFSIPIINISAGALLNAVAKYLRDRYKWEWLPV
jgi:predicted RND superfamily exporter protein